MLEVLLAVVILTLLLGIGAPIYQTVQNRNQLDIAIEDVAQSLRRAHLLAEAVDGNSGWGVAVTSSQVILFKGTDFTIRDQDFDERFDIPGTINVSGTSIFTFTKFTGRPTVTGSIQLTHRNDESRTLTINNVGTLTY